MTDIHWNELAIGRLDYIIIILYCICVTSRKETHYLYAVECSTVATYNLELVNFLVICPIAFLNKLTLFSGNIPITF